MSSTASSSEASISVDSHAVELPRDGSDDAVNVELHREGGAVVAVAVDAAGALSEGGEGVVFMVWLAGRQCWMDFFLFFFVIDRPSETQKTRQGQNRHVIPEVKAPPAQKRHM